MPPRADAAPVLVRIVEGVHGAVEMESVLRIRFGYGKIVPWVQRHGTAIRAIAGPDSVSCDSPVRLTGRNMAHEADIHGRTRATRCRSCWSGMPRTGRRRRDVDAAEALAATESLLDRTGSAGCSYQGPYRDAVHALADHAQGAHLRADRRHRRRADHLAARGHRRRAELGLPLLLAARRHHHAGGAAAHRLQRRGGRWRRVAAARGRRATRATCRSCTAWRASAGWPSGRSAGCPATSARPRSGSATPPSTSASSTSTAR